MKAFKGYKTCFNSNSLTMVNNYYTRSRKSQSLKETKLKPGSILQVKGTFPCLWGKK